MTTKASGGTALATDLLLEIEALNSEDADDEGSKAAVVTALKAAAQLPVQELEAFAEVFADLLQILDDGCGHWSQRLRGQEAARLSGKM
jgi:hypothetical protein